jgi:hypothetical protein
MNDTQPGPRENRKRGISPGDPRHGTANGYNNYGCRCDDCRAAWAVACTRYRNRWRIIGGPDDPAHGTRNGYVYWHCRCDRCLAANREASRRQRMVH